MSSKVDWQKEYYCVETKIVYRKIEKSEENNISSLKSDSYKFTKKNFYYGKKRKQYEA